MGAKRTELDIWSIREAASEIGVTRQRLNQWIDQEAFGGIETHPVKGTTWKVMTGKEVARVKKARQRAHKDAEKVRSKGGTQQRVIE